MKCNNCNANMGVHWLEAMFAIIMILGVIALVYYSSQFKSHVEKYSCEYCEDIHDNVCYNPLNFTASPYNPDYVKLRVLLQDPEYTKKDSEMYEVQK